MKEILKWWNDLTPLQRVNFRGEYDIKNNLKTGHKLTNKVIKEIYTHQKS